MDLFKWLKRNPAPASTDKKSIERDLVGEDFTEDYRPRTPARLIFGFGNQMPPLHKFYQDVEVMMIHPRVKKAGNDYKNALCDAEFEVKAKRPKVAKYIHEIYDRLWNMSLQTVQVGYNYGWHGMEVIYRYNDDGQFTFDHLKGFSPRDVRHLGEHDTGAFAGVRVVTVGGTVDLDGPSCGLAKGFWYAHQAPDGALFGLSQFLGAWRPWRRLAGMDGAEDNLDMAIYRFSVSGMKIFYKPGTPMVDEAKVDQKHPTNRDRAREVGESFKAGGNIYIPSEFDDKGNRLWDAEVPDRVLDVDSLINNNRHLKDDIAEGIGVPPELEMAAETGSGYSGRELPLESFFVGQRIVGRSIVRQFRPTVDALVEWNFGEDALGYEVDLKSLLATRAQRLGGAGGAGNRETGGPGGGGTNDSVPPKPGGGQSYNLFDPDRGNDDKMLRFATAHAPKGGVSIDGKEYTGGEFIPGHTQEEVDKAASKGKPKEPHEINRDDFFGATVPHTSPNEKLSISKVMAKMDAQSEGRLNLKEIRAKLESAGQVFAESDVPLSSLKGMDDVGVDPSRATPSKGAIIVGKDGYIIDGRHRAAKAIAEGKTHIKAIVPVVKDMHKSIVESAFAAGQHVPEEVLADYPDLAEKHKSASDFNPGGPLKAIGGMEGIFGDTTIHVNPSPDDSTIGFITGLNGKDVSGKLKDIVDALHAQGFRDVQYRADNEDGRSAARERLFQSLRKQFHDSQDNPGRDLFGNPLPRSYSSGPKLDQQSMFPGNPELGVNVGWMNAAQDLADELGKPVEQMGLGGRVKIGGEWHTVKHDGKEWKLEPVDAGKVKRLETAPRKKDSGKGQWITIGAKDGKGGSPVYIVDGRITKGHPNLTGKKLSSIESETPDAPRKTTVTGDDDSTHRQQLHHSREYAKALIVKQARKAGVDSATLHQLAGDIKSHHNEFVTEHNAMLKDARKMLDAFGGKHRTIGLGESRGGKSQVEDSLPGLDVVSREVAGMYPGMFGNNYGYRTEDAHDAGQDDAGEILIGYLREGNRTPMSDETALTESFNRLKDMKPADEVGDFEFGANADDGVMRFETGTGTKPLTDADAESAVREVLAALSPLRRKLSIDIVRAIKSGNEKLWPRVRELLQEFRNETASGLANARVAAALSAMRRVVDRVGSGLDPSASIQRPPVVPPAILAGPAGEPSRTWLPMIEEAANDLIGRNVLTAPQFYTMAADAKAEAFTVTGVNELSTLEAIRDSISKAVREGQFRKEWIQELEEKIDGDPFLSEAHRNQVFRDNVHGAYSAGMDTVLDHPLVTDHFPYYAIDPIFDHRVRPWHLALAVSGIDGTNIYRRDDPTWTTINPPSDFNCRCGKRPVTVEQAAAAVVGEAIEWLRTGVEPARPAWVPLPVGWQQSPSWSR